LAVVDILYFWDFSEAERELHNALALEPNSADVQEAKAECSRAVELDPISLERQLDSGTSLLDVTRK